jgi:phosphoethanolamine N-methyltransferase
MIKIASERNNNKNIKFIKADASNVETFPKGSFDLIWSRDTILYVEDKPQLFKNFNHWLKDDGNMVICDFGCDNKRNEDIEKYTNGKGYYLLNRDSYIGVIQDSGIDVSTSLDMTDIFRSFNQSEVVTFVSKKDDFVSIYSQEEYDYLVDRWNTKIDLSIQHQLCYFLFKGTKH